MDLGRMKLIVIALLDLPFPIECLPISISHSIFVIYELFLVIEPSGIVLLLGGGAAYTIGVIFYVTKAIPFNHAIWHCFVLVGALSHCWLILNYVLNGSQM